MCLVVWKICYIVTLFLIVVTGHIYFYVNNFGAVTFVALIV
jgi:hypothetical protein